MVRVVAAEHEAVAVDLAGGAFGRGAWVHPRPGCLGSAARRGLSRALKRRVSVSTDALIDLLRRSAARRVGGLLASARGAGKLAVGADAVRQVCARGGAQLILVAADARAAARMPEIEAQAARGRVVVWGSKAELGRMLARPDTGVVSVQSSDFAEAVARAVALSQMPAPERFSSGRSKSEESVEVR